jgi:hypothetical protein
MPWLLLLSADVTSHPPWVRHWVPGSGCSAPLVERISTHCQYLCVLCVLCVVVLFPVVEGLCKRYAMAWHVCQTMTGGNLEPMLSGSGSSELKSSGHWSSRWGARESNCSVDMGLISSAIWKWNLAFCHEAASRCCMRREAIHQSHAWSCLWNTGRDVPWARAPDFGK